jgi:hypothetical protein
MEMSLPDMRFGVGGDAGVQPRTQASVAVTTDAAAMEVRRARRGSEIDAKP